MDLTWSQVFIALAYCDNGCPVIGLALSKGRNRVGVFLHLRTETDPVSETLCFFHSYLGKHPDDGQSSKTQYLCDEFIFKPFILSLVSTSTVLLFLEIFISYCRHMPIYYVFLGARNT
jgi:hypothetical protein